MTALESGEKPKTITLVIPYYENPQMLERQLETIAGYDQVTRDHLHLIVVDDGSPRNPATITHCPVPFALYRCLVDVSWNWIFCRNLGVSRAETEWVLMTDMDHLVPAGTARGLVDERHAHDTAYRFSRASAPNMTRCKPHANSWFMTRRTFDRAGGYDERFSGYYGSDFDFRRRVAETATTALLSHELVRVPRHVIPDASTVDYSRVARRGALLRILKDRGDEPPRRLSYPWERVA